MTRVRGRFEPAFFERRGGTSELGGENRYPGRRITAVRVLNASLGQNLRGWCIRVKSDNPNTIFEAGRCRTTALEGEGE